MGAREPIRKDRRTFRSAASAGSRRRPTPSSPARAFRRSITGIARPRGRTSVLGHPASEQLRRQGSRQSRRAPGPRAVGHVRHGGQRQGVVRQSPSRARPCATSSAAGGTNRATASASTDARNPWDRTADVRRAPGEESRARRRGCTLRLRACTAIPRASFRSSTSEFEVVSAFLRVRSHAAQRARRQRRRHRAALAEGSGQLRRRLRRRADSGVSVHPEERTASVPDHRVLSERLRPCRRVESASRLCARSISSSAAAAPCSTRLQGTFERRRQTAVGKERSARRYGAVGEGFLPGRRLPGDERDIDTQRLGILQPEHGRLLRSHPGCPRAADQGCGLRLRRASLRLPARNPARELHAAR